MKWDIKELKRLRYARIKTERVQPVDAYTIIGNKMIQYPSLYECSLMLNQTMEHIIEAILKREPIKNMILFYGNTTNYTERFRVITHYKRKYERSQLLLNKMTDEAIHQVPGM